jgi:phosphate transport system protein
MVVMMDLTPEEFDQRIDEIRAKLAEQGHAVISLVDAAIDAFYTRDAAEAAGVAAEDDRIDRVDVEIERESVDLLIRTAACACNLDAGHLRRLLAIVKINNELERIADAGADIAELVTQLADPDTRFPETTMVMTNSVLGLLRDSVACFEAFNPDTARVVLQSEHVVLAFKIEILQKAEKRVADATMAVDSAFNLHELVSLCMLIADHCTNIAEQIIYEQTGMIVRHMDGTWEEREAEG